MENSKKQKIKSKEQRQRDASDTVDILENGTFRLQILLEYGIFGTLLFHKPFVLQGNTCLKMVQQWTFQSNWHLLIASQLTTRRVVSWANQMDLESNQALAATT